MVRLYVFNLSNTYNGASQKSEVRSQESGVRIHNKSGLITPFRMREGSVGSVGGCGKCGKREKCGKCGK